MLPRLGGLDRPAGQKLPRQSAPPAGPGISLRSMDISLDLVPFSTVGGLIGDIVRGKNKKIERQEKKREARYTN